MSIVVALVAAFCLLSCHDSKAANKANFKRAIQASLDKRPSCLPVSMPTVPRSAFDGRPRADPPSEALVAAGLANKTRIIVANSGWSLFGGPKEVPASRYDFTAEGRKYIDRPQYLYLPTGADTICYGVPEIIDVIRYSEPGNAMGQTMTQVTYTYALKSIAPWTKKAVLLQQFPELTQIKTPDHPGEQQLDLVLMSDGWRVANRGF